MQSISNDNLSNGSVWELTAPSPPALESLQEDMETDVLIIGAGYTGLSTALQLRKSSVDTTVIEAKSIGWGASGRNGGHVVPLIRKDPENIIQEYGEARGESLLKMVAESADCVFDLIETHEIKCDAERNGWLQPIHSEEQLSISRRRLQQWTDYNADMELLDSEGTHSLMASDQYIAGLLVKSGGHINPLAFVRGLASTAVNRGARLFIQTPAISMAREGKSWKITTPAASILANKVVLATAAYTDRLWPQLQRTYLPFYLYNVATTPLTPEQQLVVLPGQQPATDTRGDARVFHYDGERRLIHGSTFIFSTNWESRLIQRARRVMTETFPGLSSIHFETNCLWRGKVSMTPDVLPHLHVLSPGVYTWLGCNGRGVAFSTRMGSVLSRLVQGASMEELEMPPGPMKAIPAHEFARLMTSVMLAYYRLRDKVS